MAFEYDNCLKRFEVAPHGTVTGRRLCTSCDDQLLGQTAAAVLGGPGGATAGGLATAGWYARVKALARKAKSGG